MDDSTAVFEINTYEQLRTSDNYLELRTDALQQISKALGVTPRRNRQYRSVEKVDIES